MNKKLLLLFLVFILLVNVVTPQPPTPHNVRGRVTYPDGTGVENGIPVRIIDNTNGEIVNTQVNAPPVPQLAGAYSATITGNTGDSITVRAWNATHYGEFNTTLAATTTIANVTLNLTRTSELNVSIYSPGNNTLHNISNYFNTTNLFNITVNVTNIGGQTGTTCDAQIRFGNSSVLSVVGSATNNMGSIPVGQTVNITFTVFGIAVGTSNVTVNGSCDSDGVNFEMLTSDSIFNVTIIDEVDPIVSLISPINNTFNLSSNGVNFTYNVTDGSPIANCSLIIDSVVNQTNSTVVRAATQTFSDTLPNGNYRWRVNCTDALGNIGTSGLYNLTLAVFFPNITIVNVTQQIVLNAGSLKIVQCNFTVEDGNGESDIASVNSTFFFSQNLSSHPDNNNYHYTNSSCTLLGSAGIQRNYSCHYNVLYYAVNGSWICNATAIDQQSLSDYTVDNATINTLFALNTSIDTIDYGDLAVTQTSAEIVLNVSNIGNREINITVRGFGGTDPVSGDGLAMVCTDNNITIDNERFSQASSPFAGKTQLSSTATGIGYTIPKQTAPSLIRENTSFWQITIPALDPAVGIGVCNGSIVFQAEAVN